MRISTFFFLTRRGLRNLGKHWAMTIACIASLSVCMTLNSFASLAEVNVDSMVSYRKCGGQCGRYGRGECGQHGGLSGQPERDRGVPGP